MIKKRRRKAVSFLLYSPVSVPMVTCVRSGIGNRSVHSCLETCAGQTDKPFNQMLISAGLVFLSREAGSVFLCRVGGALFFCNFPCLQPDLFYYICCG